MALNRAPKGQTAEDRLFAHSVRVRREAMGLSLERMGDLVGLAGQTIYLIENERRGVSRGEAVQFARAFEVTVEQMTEATEMSAVRLHHLVGDLVRGLETDLHDHVDVARSRLDEVRDLLRRAASEIDPTDPRSEPMSRYLAESINDAVYVVQELPAYLDSLERSWDELQELIDGSEPPKASSWADELARALRLAAQEHLG